MLPRADFASTILLGSVRRHEAAGACRRYWKHLEGHQALTPRMTCWVMGSPFVRSQEENEYQHLLAEVRRRPIVLTVVAIDLSSLAEDFERVYVLAKLT